MTAVTAFCAAAAAASLLVAAASGHETSMGAGLASPGLLPPKNSQRDGAEGASVHGVAAVPQEERRRRAADGEDEDTSFLDKISAALFGDNCDRTDKEVSGLTDLSDWQASALADTALLTDMTIPGTHQSACYDLSTTPNPHDLEYKRLEGASYNLPDAVIAPWICRFSLTQSLNLSEQLQAGVRYFDLRIDLDSDAGTFRAFHVLFGPTLEDLLGQIAEFAKKHPNEIVLVEMTELINPDVTDSDRDTMRQIVLDSFGGALVPQTDALPTVGELRTAGTTVLVSVEDADVSSGSDLLWDTSAFFNTFANTPSVNAMVSRNANLLDVEFPKKTALLPLKKLSWTLTPDEDFIRDNVLSGGLYDLANEANGELRTFAAERAAGTKLGDVLLLDYVETSPMFDVLGLSGYSGGEFTQESAAPRLSAAAFSFVSSLLILAGGLCFT